MANPLRVVSDFMAENPLTQGFQQLPYTFTDTLVLFGSPLIPVAGLDSIKCRYNQPRAKKFSSLGGGAAFLSNRNTGGTVELRFQQGAISVAITEFLNFSGVPMPMVISDISTGGTASVICTACRIVDIGEYAREGETPLITVTFEADRMVLFHGLRLPDNAK